MAESRKIEVGCMAIVRGYRNVYPVRIVKSRSFGRIVFWVDENGVEHRASELRRVTTSILFNLERVHNER